MKLPQLSIQNSLLLALALLLILLVMSSLVSWLAFDQVNDNQEALLEDSLPSMRTVNQAIDTGAKLLNLGDLLSSPLPEKELVFFEAQAQSLFVQIKQDMADLRDNSVSSIKSTSLSDNTRYLMEAIEQLLSVQKVLVANAKAINYEKDEVFGAVQQVLIDIKLVESELSLALMKADDAKKEALRYRLVALTSQRFNAQRISSLINETLLVSDANQVARSEDLYRLEVQKLGLQLLEFEPDYRRRLVTGINLLNDHLLKQDNLFELVVLRAQGVKELADTRSRILSLNEILVEEYQKLSRQANLEIDAEAKNILQVVNASKITIVVTVLLSVFVITLFSLLFVRPRIVSRIQRLTDHTRAIAQGEYDIDINISGADEISAMAESLSYFRNQLVEKEEFQRALTDREQTLSIIIENAAEGLMTVDIEGFIQTFNPACERMFDIFSEQAVTSKIDDFLPDEQKLFLTHGKQAPTPAEGLIVCQDKPVIATKANGQTFDGSLSVSLVNLSGRFVYSCFIRDVTEERKAKEQVDRLISELSSSNADLESFAYSCSHDLQEPVRIMSAFSQLLKEHLAGELDETGERYLGFIQRSSDEAKSLIKSILDYSRLEQSSSEKVWVSIDDLGMRIQDALSILIEETQGQFVWGDGHVRVQAVESQLFQVVVNLVINGLKYNKSEMPKVALSIEDNADHWLIIVSDNGIGINPRYHQQIFELFNRLVNRKDYSGSGIGLALCKKIVERHGGEIWLESEPDQGSEFFVRLPKLQ